jgi:hypothetical protein
MDKRIDCKILGLLLGLILFAQPARATTIPFTVPAASIGVTYQGTDVDFFSPALNGTVLSGQGLSLDLVLANDVLARLSLFDASQLGVGLTVFTNAGTSPGFAGTTTGFLLNSNGAQLGQSQDAGRSQGSNGTFSMGLVTFSLAGLGGSSVIDIKGAHFDTVFPNTGYVVQDARLRFTLNSNSEKFGTAQQLPETTTLMLVLIGLLFQIPFIRRLTTQNK